MIDNRGSRFAFEVLFLVALAAVLAIATVRPLVIVGVMALGWVIVAALEWAVWRGQPHYGSGLPPRYYVPRLNLPPASIGMACTRPSSSSRGSSIRRGPGARLASRSCER